MPRFFFNVHDGQNFPDLQGTELGSLDSARVEAVRFAAAHLRDQARQFWTGDGWSMDVCDESGLLLFSLKFSAVQMPAAERTPFQDTEKS